VTEAPPPNRRRVLAYVPDLMDRSKLAVLPDEVVFVRALDALGAAEPGDVVLLDISRGSLPDLADGVRSIGFGSHVDDDARDAARAAGVDEVLPRSVFFRRLAQGELL
jgi:hypothetical protein